MTKMAGRSIDQSKSLRVRSAHKMSSDCFSAAAVRAANHQLRETI
jgi:hypothetical protein